MPRDKSSQPACIEYYDKRFPQLTQEERQQLLLELKIRKKAKQIETFKLGNHVQKLEYWRQKFSNKTELELIELRKQHNQKHRKHTSPFSNLSEIESKIAKRAWAPSCIEFWLRKGYSLEDAIEKRSQFQKNRSNKYDRTNNPFVISSKIELEFIQSIQTHFDIQVNVQHKLIENDRHYYYDGQYENIIFEFHGDFWHANPNKFSENSIMKNGFTAKQIWEFDRIKQSIAESKGYIYCVVWEYDWINNRETVIEKLKSILNINI